MRSIFARVFEALGRFQHLPAGGQNIFDDEDCFARVEDAFDEFAGAVILLLVAHDDERLPACHRSAAAKGTAPSSAPAIRSTLRGDFFREELAQLDQTSGWVSNRYLSR